MVENSQSEEARGQNGRDAAEKPAESAEARTAKKCPCRKWGKLIFVALVAAVIGALVSANWRPRPFSFVFFFADIEAGIVILGSAALGFVLGIVFMWSALTKE